MIVTTALDIAGVRSGKKAFIGPEHVVIDLTNRCDLNCLGCWTNSPLLRDKEPSFSWRTKQLPSGLVERLIDELGELGTRRIRFTGGGEPLLHHNLFSFAKRIKDKGLLLAITTSFTKADRTTVDKLIEIGVDTLSVSLWAGTPETFSRTHPNRTERTFVRTAETLRYLIENRGNGKPEVILCNVVCSTNFHETRQMLEFALDIGADGVYFTLVDAVPQRTDGLLLNSAQRKIVIDESKEIAFKVDEEHRRGRAFLLDNFAGFLTRLKAENADQGIYDTNELTNLPCTIGWQFCRILADGKVVPCCRGANHPLGDLHEHSFKEIWFSDRYNDFRQKALTLPKDHPYFAELNCYTMCDNLMHIKELQRRIGQLPGDVLADLRQVER